MERSHDATRTSARQDSEERCPGIGRLCRGRNAACDAEAAQAAVATQFDGWQNVLAARLEELAVAISTGRPEFFVEQVHWTRAALEARGVPAEMLRARLEALRRVLVEQIPAELAPMATGYIDRALAEFGGEPAGLTPRLTAETPAERLAATYLVAILEGDRRKAIRLILKAADEGQSVPDLYLRVLQPAQEELGRMWLLGEINVAEEHFATTTTRLVMAQLHAREVCGPSNGKTLVAAAVAGNQHDLGIQVVADLFEMDGWRVIQLGSNVPVDDLAQAVEFYDADLVALSVSLATQLPALEETIAAVRESERGVTVKILVGGCGMMGAAELAKSKGADDYASQRRGSCSTRQCARRTACENASRSGRSRKRSFPSGPQTFSRLRARLGRASSGSVCRDRHGRMAMASQRCRGNPCQHDPRQADQRVDDSAKPRRWSEQSRHKVELEQAHQSPVHGPNDYQNQSKPVSRFHRHVSFRENE